MIYHVQESEQISPSYQYEADSSTESTAVPRTKVQLILFLSKLLNTAERNYWPTELKVAGIVWVIKRVRHMIESTKVPPIIVYTDHSAAVSISKQTSLITFSTNKLNLRLVRASQYLSGFELAIRHKAGKANIVSDALSRLKNDTIVKEQEPSILNVLYGHSMKQESEAPSYEYEEAFIYHVTLIEMSDDFKVKLKEAYEKDEQWKKVLDLVKPSSDPTTAEPEQEPVSASPAEPEPTVGIRFKYRNELLYYINFDDGRERLCIPIIMKQQIFHLAHDQQHHGEYHRIYERIIPSVYIRHLTKHLRAYINHCSICAINQIKRHKSYGSLVSIDRPNVPFHIIAMDFVIALSGELDSLLIITDKFSKRILLISGKTIYNAVKWVNIVLTEFMSHDWGIPNAIISDRDSKFMSFF